MCTLYYKINNKPLSVQKKTNTKTSGAKKSVHKCPFSMKKCTFGHSETKIYQ